MNTYDDNILRSGVPKLDDFPNAIPIAYSDPFDQPEPERHLRDYVHVLFRRKWTFFTFFVVVVTTILLHAFLTTPVYRATVTLKIDDDRPAVMLFDRSNSYAPPPSEDYLQTVHKTLQSRNLARRVINALAQDKQIAPSSAVPAGMVGGDGDIDSGVVANLLSKVTVSPVPNTRLVLVGFDSTDPAIAATTANVIAQACAELNMETKSNSNLARSNIQVLDKADVPSAPYKPDRKRKMLLALFIGFFGGLGLAFFTDYLDNTVKTRDDVEKAILLPALGLVPNFPKAPENGIRPLIDPLDKKSSSLFESYRAIGTYIQFASPERPPRVILITSAKRSEGKTTTSVSLATILASSQRRGIIIDGDLRKPAVHKVFELDNSNGLTAFLTGPTDFDNGLIQETNVPNLDVITAGSTPPNPSQLLDSSRMRELINALVPLYSFIIIDAPPVLGLSDTLILSTMTEGVILVVRAGDTAKDSVIQTKKLLKNVNSKILGVVLNGVRESDLKYDSQKSPTAAPIYKQTPRSIREAVEGGPQGLVMK